MVSKEGHREGEYCTRLTLTTTLRQGIIVVRAQKFT